MFKKIKSIKIILTILFSFFSTMCFIFSLILSTKYNTEHTIWLSNFLMGIGASFLASILYSIFSETTTNKYNIYKEDLQIKKDIFFTRWESIELGYNNAKKGFLSGNYIDAVNWSRYFYEKVNKIRFQLISAQKYEYKLKKDKFANQFISEAHNLYKEFLKIEDSSNIKDFNEETGNQIINNIEKCYALYDRIYYSILGDSTELEKLKNKYRFK